MIRVKNLIEYGVFRELELIAGGNGLSRSVSSISVAAIPDMTPWLSGGDALITVAASMEEPEQLPVLYIRQLAKQNGACLIIYLEDGGVSRIPEDAVRLANELRVPLFTPPWEMKIASLIHDLTELLLTEKTRDKWDIWNHLLLSNQKSVIEKHSSMLLEPILDYDRKNSDSLLTTLEAYLSVNGSRTEASKLLYIHRNTLAQRIEKIESLTKKTLNSAVARNDFYNALRVHSLIAAGAGEIKQTVMQQPAKISTQKNIKKKRGTNKVVEFTLNGKRVSVEMPEKETLLKYLRNIECMKGTKEACSTGHCGACSVLIDGQLARSCVILLKNLGGRSVETIENMARDGKLSEIQRSFLDVGAVQCGFCTPGMVIATKALLSKNLNPTEEAIGEGLKNNYCRCTGYVKIIEAVKLAAARLRGETPDIDAFRTGETTTIMPGSDCDVPPLTGYSIGKALWDVDGVEKVTGSLKFCDDFEADEFGEDEMLHGAFIFAPAPRAKILGMDLSAAGAMPGVRRIITADDTLTDALVGTWTPEQPVFCRDQVNFLGDVLGLVIADSDATARAAAIAVKIDYEEIPGVYTIPNGYARKSFLLQTGRTAGDVAAAKEQPGLTKIVVSKEMERQEHACMEPESAIGYGQNDKVTLYSCTQSPFEIRRMLSKILGLPEENVRVVATPLGGGFGSKCDSVIEAQTALAGYLMQKPVKVTLNRQESLLLSSKRHAYHTDYEVGFRPDGKIAYLESKMFSDGGPYTTESYGTLMTGCLMAGGPYRIDNVKIEGSAIHTNNVLGGAFRGYGINQAALSIETVMDMAAEQLGIDPFELRRRNGIKAGSYSVGGELLQDSVGLMDTINQCEKRLRKALKEYEGKYPDGSKVLGWGMASGFKNVGIGKGIFTDDGACKLTLKGDGRLHMICSGTDMGQGFRTAMVQIAAEVLQMDPANIDIEIGDTDITIPTGQSVSERQTLCGGRAVYEACLNLQKVLEESPWKPGEERNAQYYYVSPPTFAIGNFKGAEEKGVPYRNFPAYAYTTQAAIVEVDKTTGKIRLLKVIAAHDVGRAINPHIIEGQIQGSCSMGQGYALTEAYPCKNGYPTKKSYLDLGLPKAEDTPEYDLILIEDPEPTGPFGAKGISEVATVPITPAILNAIYSAVGVRINRIPATPDVILEAIRTGKCNVPTVQEMISSNR